MKIKPDAYKSEETKKLEEEAILSLVRDKAIFDAKKILSKQSDEVKEAMFEILAKEVRDFSNKNEVINV